MIRKNKWKILISSLLIIVPSIAALILKDMVKKALLGAWYFTWIMPVLMLLIHFFCIFLTLRDNASREQSSKILNLCFWIIPAISIFVSSIFMMIALGLITFTLKMIVPLFISLTFIIMGNFMPKATRNRTFGIKVKWALANDDNWAATHRFSAKLWVICGLALIPLCFVPFKISIFLVIAVTVAAVIPPIVYSYLFYKRQIREGTATEEEYRNYASAGKDKKSSIAAVIIFSVLIVLITIMMFVGKIDYTLTDTSLSIDTTYGGALTLDYADIDSVEYDEDGIDGVRLNGYASAKILFGLFDSEDIGHYVRYTYTGGGPVIVIHTGDEILVIADETPELTKSLFDEIYAKVK